MVKVKPGLRAKSSATITNIIMIIITPMVMDISTLIVTITPMTMTMITVTTTITITVITTMVKDLPMPMHPA